MNYNHDLKYCPNCGTRNEEYKYSHITEIKESNYYELKSKKEIESLEPNPSKKDSTTKGIICSHCKTENEVDSKFCIECGLALSDSEESFETSIMYCPNCDTVIYEGDLFCSECGTKLN